MNFSRLGWVYSCLGPLCLALVSLRSAVKRDSAYMLQATADEK